MSNLIITKNCNLKCDYCFARVNYNNKRYEISLHLYLLYLKHLSISKDNTIRLLGGEPLIHSKIRTLLLLGLKGNFNITIFTNLCLPNKIIKTIFSGLNDKITVVVNVNKKDFYKEHEINNLFKNIELLKSNNIRIKLGYLVYNNLGDESFIFELALKYGISEIHLKPYNFNGVTNYGTDTYEYGDMFYQIIKKYGDKYNINISCGFSKNILKIEKQEELKNKYKINFRFGCYANGGKYDINYDGKIFRCFGLEHKFKNIDFNLKKLYGLKSSNIIKKLQKIVNTDNDLNCVGYKNIS